MPLKTTVVGSFPKPDYIPTPNWFTNQSNFDPKDFSKVLEEVDPAELSSLQDRGLREVLKEQQDLGLDIVTDGEICRENYIFHFCRHCAGFDFKNTNYKLYRNGAVGGNLPVIRGHVTPLNDQPWVVDEWKKTQAMTTCPVKVTIPGPMTIIGTTDNVFYKYVKELSLALVSCINKEVRALASAGCTHIQIDEPVLVRSPQVALQYGIEHLSQCFQGIDQSVTRTIHMCCGYPEYLDQEGYVKADNGCYQKIAKEIDDAGFDAVSLEDAHRHNDLALFDMFKKVTVILGVVKVASSQVESKDEIRGRVQQVLEHVPAERLMLAPDCGLGFLPNDILKQKLGNMVAVAKSMKV